MLDVTAQRAAASAAQLSSQAYDASHGDYAKPTAIQYTQQHVQVAIKSPASCNPHNIYGEPYEVVLLKIR